MKRRISIGVVALLATMGASFSALAATPQKQVASLFSQICIGMLPDYVGATEVLEEAGYVITPFGGDDAVEFEFGHPTSGIWGGFEIGSVDASCSVIHEHISKAEARELGLSVIGLAFKQDPEVWSYNGEPSGWTVPYGDRRFYVIFSEGGLSSDIRDD